MNLLILNCGSSSLKLQLRDQPVGAPRSGTGRVLASGLVQGIGGPAELLLRREGVAPRQARAPVPDYVAAVRIALDWLAPRGGGAGGLSAPAGPRAGR